MKALLLLAIALSATLLPAADFSAAWKRHTIDGSSRGADGVRLADVNGDGRPDIVTGWEQGGVTRIYVNPGNAKAKEKWPAVTVGRTTDAEDAVLADLDGDGALDVVSSCEGKTRAMYFHWAPQDKSRYLDPGAWRQEVFPASTNGSMWMFCLPLQVDGKHGVDLVAGSKSAGAQVGWFESPAEAHDLAAWKWHPLRPSGWIMSLAASDMDGDGDLDVVFSDRKGKRSGCFWLEHPGTSRDLARPWKEHLMGVAGEEVMFLQLADVDRDGLEDAVVAVSKSDLSYLRRLDRGGDRWSAHAIPIPANAGLPKAVNVGDIDLDGRPDVVFTCEHAEAPKQGVWWLSSDGTPTSGRWNPHAISGVDGVKHDLVQLQDLDGDGDLDVITCEEVKNLGVFWYENPVRQPK
jgi:hypothetical protein